MVASFLSLFHTSLLAEWHATSLQVMDLRLVLAHVEAQAAGGWRGCSEAPLVPAELATSLR